jgi:oligopeptide transport system permease protein
MSDLTTAVTTAEPPPTVQAEPGKEHSASLWADARRELLRNPIFVVSSLYILLMLSFATLPWLWTSKDPQDCRLDYGSMSPMFSPGFWMGTSQRGCDYWSHAVYGASPSLQIAIYATTGIVLIGLPLGVLAGFYGGWVDAVISRLVDIVFALPFLLGALVILAMLRKYNKWTITMVLVVLGWTTVARIMRSSVLATKNLDYVQAAKALGATNSRLMFRHILPNAIAPVFVIATVALGGFVATEATLTFLGVGLQHPAVSWGLMISTHDDYIELAPHLTLIPVTLLVGTVLSFILIGDALRDALDPKLR